MSSLYKLPAGASPIHQTAAQYLNGFNSMDLETISATFDDEAFEWSMFPATVQIPVFDKEKAVAYMRDFFMPTMESFVFDVISLTEPNEKTIICHLTGKVTSKLGNVLNNEYLIVLEFVPSKIEGGLPKIGKYTEFMDSKAVTEFQAAEKESKARLG